MTDSAIKYPASTRGIFAGAALEFFDRGLCPMPAGGPEGNAPLIRWAKWRRRPPREVFRRLAGRPNMLEVNIGILTGLSGITIVDCDEPDYVERAFALFGETPLVTATPSGGHHLWYRGGGERCHNLRSQGLPIDIKGMGGFSVEPPSRRPSGPHAGRVYRFALGDLADLGRLPRIPVQAAARFGLRAKPAGTSAAVVGDQGATAEGKRNITLFRAGLWFARDSESLEALTATLHTVNAQSCTPPLPDAEVARIACSAWRYEATGRNMVGTGAFVIANDRLDAFVGPDAFFLLAKLWRFHAARSEPFALVPNRMAAEGVLPGMSATAIRRAREVLVAAGYLVLVRKGGRGPRDPSRYRLGTDPRISLPI